MPVSIVSACSSAAWASRSHCIKRSSAVAIRYSFAVGCSKAVKLQICHGDLALDVAHLVCRQCRLFSTHLEVLLVGCNRCFGLPKGSQQARGMLRWAALRSQDDDQTFLLVDKVR